MKYESEILYDLMKRDGLLNPSQDNLPYESELKEKYVDEVKGAYPKVIDYRPEWMNYNLGYYIPADFPIESIENVTSGTVNNVVPYAFKSAILLGNTLVNLLTKSNIKITSSKSSVIDYVYQLDTTKTYIIQYCINQLPELSDTSESGRAFKFEWYDGGLSKGNKNIYNKEAVLKRNTYIKIEPFSDNVSRTNFSVWCPNYTSGTLDIDIMIIEYQEGMENWDIPYFEGMQSVKLPVLTTVGKNLFDVSSYVKGTLEKQFYSQNGDKLQINALDSRSSTTYATYKVKKGETLTLSTNPKLPVRIFDVKSDIMYNSSTDGILTYTAETDGEIGFKFIANEYPTLINVQLEKGSVATPYEPYKSNILTVNEEVELRGIGDVKDELNCLTGEIVSNFSTYSFSDVDNWKINTEANCQRFTLRISPSPIGSDYSDKVCIISDKLPGVKWNQSWNTVNTISCNSDSIAVQLPLGTTIEQFKELMRGSKIVYRIKSSIKTVDLTNVNQDGVPSTFRPFEGTMHIQTDGTPLKPLFNGEIPVEATTQNLASFVNLEGVERTVNEYEEIVGDDNNEQLL